MWAVQDLRTDRLVHQGRYTGALFLFPVLLSDWSGKSEGTPGSRQKQQGGVGEWPTTTKLVVVVVVLIVILVWPVEREREREKREEKEKEEAESKCGQQQAAG